MTTINSSNSNDRLVSDLPLHVFDKLVARPHSAIANPIDLRQQILFKLQANTVDDGSSITAVRALLKLSPPTMLRTLDPCLTYVECNRLLSRIYRECAAKPLSALEMMRRAQSSSIEKIPTGLSSLDHQLHGGLPVGSVVEIVGRAGAGKTHLSQQLCVLASQSGGGAVFIDAEKKLNLMRLREIAFERFLQKQQHHLQNQHANELADQVLENVTIHSLVSTQDLLDKLDDIGNEITSRNSDAAQYEQSGNVPNASTRRRLPVRLIVIDSIAAPIRRDYDMMGGSSSNTAALRASALFQIAKRLKQLAYDYQVAVVVINQVGSGGMFSNRNDLQRNNALDIRDGEFTASLGTAWQYCVSTRIVFEHEDDPHRLQQEQPGDGENCIRVATLAKSLVSKRFKLSFELTKRGLCEVSD